MADTVTFQTTDLATPPEATIIATDDCGAAGHAQIVKLGIATDGSATTIPADANGLKVQAGTDLNTSALALESGGNLAAAATSLAALDNAVAGSELQVDIVSSALPSGAATEAKQDTANTLLGTIDADTGGILTAVQTLDNAISGSEMQVDVVGALPAGTNAIGKLAANSGVDIGDVDVTSIAAGDNNIGNVDVVTLPAKKITYAASTTLTQTSLDGLAASSTHVAGWESDAIDNSTNLYLDYIINAKVVTEGSGVTAGEIKMWLVAEMDDSTWPDVFDGTQSTETVTDTEIRDAICRLAATTVNDTTTARTYYLMCPSVAAVFNGVVPRKFVVFITQATGTTLETTGDPNQVYVKGVYLT